MPCTLPKLLWLQPQRGPVRMTISDHLLCTPSGSTVGAVGAACTSPKLPWLQPQRGPVRLTISNHLLRTPTGSAVAAVGAAFASRKLLCSLLGAIRADEQQNGLHRDPQGGAYRRLLGLRCRESHRCPPTHHTPAHRQQHVGLATFI